MNLGQEKVSTAVNDNEVNVPPTALQQAIRRRALDTIAEQQSRPQEPWSRRLLIIGLTLVAMLIFVAMINFVITGMQRIMDIWYPGSISDRATQPTPAPLGIDQPFYITVDPPLNEAQSSAGVTSSESSAATDLH